MAEELKLVRGYPEYMLESIERVHATRAKRMEEGPPPAMSLEEREKLLEKYHPDYAPGGKRPLKVGPNKGDIAPNEVADLLEAYPLVEPGELELKVDIDVDILILGGGLAGTMAAIWANESGIPPEGILLATKLRHGDSNSIMAQGGTQAADKPYDSPTIHFLDAMGGGHFTNKPDVLKALVEDAPFIVKWLTEQGALFDRDENGEFVFVGLGTNAEVYPHISTLAFEPFLVEDGHITWAPDFGQLGKESYPATLLPVQKEMELMCVAFECTTLDVYNLIDPRSFHVLSAIEVLEAASNSPPPVYGSTLPEPTWWGFWGPTASVFIQPEKSIKITASAGMTQKRMLLLNVPEAPPEGELFNTGVGFKVDETPAIHRTYLQSARDIWRLNESRLAFFRKHGIENARVNTLHELSGAAIERAEKHLDAREYQEYFVEARRHSVVPWQVHQPFVRPARAHGADTGCAGAVTQVEVEAEAALDQDRFARACQVQGCGHCQRGDPAGAQQEEGAGAGDCGPVGRGRGRAWGCAQCPLPGCRRR